MILCALWAPTLLAQQTNLAVTVRHAPNLNGNGLIEGSLQQLLGENATINGGFTLTGDFLAPGMPTLKLNGNASIRYFRPRTDAVTPRVAARSTPPVAASRKSAAL